MAAEVPAVFLVCLYEAIHACWNISWDGGHFAAVGPILLLENVEAFINKFEQVSKWNYSPDSLTPILVVDAEVSFKDCLLFLFIKLSSRWYTDLKHATCFLWSVRNIMDSGESKLIKNNILILFWNKAIVDLKVLKL